MYRALRRQLGFRDRNRHLEVVKTHGFIDKDAAEKISRSAGYLFDAGTVKKFTAGKKDSTRFKDEKTKKPKKSVAIRLDASNDRLKEAESENEYRI